MKFAQSKGLASSVRPVKNATPRGRAARMPRVPSIRTVALYTAFAWASMTAATAMAETNPDAVPNEAPEADLSIKAQPTSQWTGVWNRGNLLGDIGGLRPWLGKYGITFGLTETSEYLYNTRGGLNTGGTYDGLTTATVQVDTKKAFGLPGGLFNVSALNIHGQNLSADNLGTLNTASGIEAQDTTRLWELWYQQSFLNNKMDVKVGQQSIDQEFIGSQSAGLFVNTMFGWPALPSYDMPSGGPAYPLADLGVRLRGQITPQLTALAGVFDGDPLGNNPQNISGTNFNLHTGALYIGELQYALNQPGDGEMVGAANSGLPGVYKLGFWYNTGSFADQHYDNTGLSLANPASTGVAQQHRGDYSFYAVADQMVWRPDPDEPRSVNVFARVMGAPGDRNLVDFSANLGVVMKAPFAGRDNDSVGLALTYIKVSNSVQDLDLDNRAFSGGPYGVRTQETTLEATYQYQVNPWWQLQADAQYTFNAGAGQNPSDPTQPLRNTFVVGVRTNITF
ncbi:carbohydrate porin [Paraburkholderia phenazinium]|jgi:porin|uniref:Porin, OprB family n=1 Tax=Paraburkholderia phenazinium TaxID=60549 RepID=A0A1G8G8K4_9BURK|nr:carbohydrate porin [Paraburkholderia phenazinium]SDH90620.1 porin, OprB family [Paraburkholderia phenazinium]